MPRRHYVSRLGSCTAKLNRVCVCLEADCRCAASPTTSKPRVALAQARKPTKSPQRPPQHRMHATRYGRRPAATAVALPFPPISFHKAAPICTHAYTRNTPLASVAFRHAAFLCSCRIRCNDPSRSWVVCRPPYMPRWKHAVRPPCTHAAQEPTAAGTCRRNTGRLPLPLPLLLHLLSRPSPSPSPDALCVHVHVRRNAHIPGPEYDVRRLSCSLSLRIFSMFAADRPV